MTHSMGGLPALMLLASSYDKFSRAILCAPMTRFYPNTAKRVAVRTMAGTASNFGWSRVSVVGVKEHSLDFEDNVLTTDRQRHERFRELQAAAPNATIGSPTYGWVNASIHAMDKIHKPDALAGMVTPTLIISAEEDQLIDASDHCELASAYGQIECITIKGALHEIMMERDDLRNQYWAAVDGFIDPAFNGKK
jgi:lysophospholipase